ncbi:MAG: Rpn family recombination-promoting nuclease/putative transposase [Chlamydiales bacterium]|nr:Rpn family recombination-promoting nuclease/putative transposase [Chlamydiales bacterium]
MVIHRYLDPKNDLAFKKIFGEEKHKRIPISFLNAALNLEGDAKIVDLEFINTVQSPEIEARKESIVDVLVRDQKGTRYIIEMQVARIEGFEKRAQFYAAKAYCSHFNKGGQYSDLAKVVFLAITDYVVFPDKPGYKCNHEILDTETYEQDLKDFSFTFVELPKFNLTFDELTSLEEQWYYFLKNTNDTAHLPTLIANHPEIKEAYEVLDRFNWNEAELNAYDRVFRAISDEICILAAAKTEGRAEGRAEGLREGLEEGLKAGKVEGLREGIEKGKKEAAINLAKELLTILAIEQVADITHLSKEELEKIKS